LDFSYFSNIYTLSQVLHIDLSEEENRKKRNTSKEKNSDIDLDIVDWNWFDEDE